MLEIATDRLTERERECLKHIRRAREREVSFAQYCRSIGLMANEWHAVRHGMVKKGLLPPGQGGKTKKTPSRRKRAHFIPVRVESSNGAGSGTGMACRTASSVRIYYRVCQLAGSKLDERTAGAQL